MDYKKFETTVFAMQDHSVAKMDKPNVHEKMTSINCCMLTVLSGLLCDMDDRLKSIENLLEEKK